MEVDFLGAANIGERVFGLHGVSVALEAGDGKLEGESEENRLVWVSGCCNCDGVFIGKCLCPYEEAGMITTDDNYSCRSTPVDRCGPGIAPWWYPCSVSAL